MSCRDPMEERAEIILCNLHFWWAEVRLMEPRVVGLPVRDLLDNRPRPVDGPPGNPVEAFVLQRFRWLRSLAIIRGVLRRLPPHVRRVYRLYYREDLTRDEISGAMSCHVSTVDKRLAIIRGRVIGCLRRMRREDRTSLCQLAKRLCPTGREAPEKGLREKPASR